MAVCRIDNRLCGYLCRNNTAVRKRHALPCRTYDAVPNIRYGGDAYTGIQNAAAYTGNAVAALYKLLSTCFGLTFLFFGLVDICVFARKIQMAQSCVCADEPEEAGQEACAESTAAEASGQ